MSRISVRCVVTICVCFSSFTWGQNQDPMVKITGRGTKNFIPRFTSHSTVGSSRIFHSPSMSVNGYLNLVGIGTTSPNGTLDINVGLHKNAFGLGDYSAGSFFLIRDTSPGFVDIQTFNADLGKL
jgi:hypothetical protein